MDQLPTLQQPDEPSYSRSVMAVQNADRIPRAVVARTLGLYVGLCHLVPLVGGLAAVMSIHVLPPNLLVITTAIIMWALTLGAGITVGYHRLFSHRAFQTTPTIRVLLTIFGSMAGQGPLIAWVALHRCHHQHTDVEGDPHSPWPNGPSWFQKMTGLWHAHFGWVLTYGIPDSLHYCPDLIRDRVVSRTSRLFLFWYVLGLCLPAVVVGLVTQSWRDLVLTFLWAGCVRVAVTSQVTWCINSLCHFFGRVSHETGDHSTNLGWLALPSFGESWHNNHHAYPRSAMFGHRLGQLDLGYALIWSFERLGLVWDVQRPVNRGADQQ